MKEPAMKVFLLLTVCSASFAASAQVTDTETLQKRVEEFNKRYKSNRIPNGNISLMKPELRKNLGTINSLQLPNTRVLGSKLGVMPCIVPDVSEIAVIPNAATKAEVPFRGSMPNAAPVKPVLPEAPKK